MKPKTPLLKPFRGSLVEYMLPALLVGVMTLGSVVWMISGGFKNQGALTVFQGESLDPSVKGLMNIRPMGENPYWQPYQFQLENGEFVTLPGLPSSVANAIEVDGAHGTTDRFLAALDDLTAQLLASGEIDQAEADYLKTLSTSGFTLGGRAKLLETLAKDCGNSKSCIADQLLNQHVTDLYDLMFTSTTHFPSYGGVGDHVDPMTPQDLKTFESLYPGVLTGLREDEYFGNDPANAQLGKPMLGFLRDYQAVKDKANLSPRAQAMVDYLARNIFSISQATGGAGNQLQAVRTWEEELQGIPLEQGKYAQVTPDQMSKLISSEVKRGEGTIKSRLIDAHSGQICTMADGTTHEGKCK